MSLLKNIMLIKEEEIEGVVFATKKHEGGINVIYDPQVGSEFFQVFVQTTFPCRETFSQLFADFRSARNFAASYFKEGWELLNWKNKVLNRPCAKGDACGGGQCSTKKEGEGCGGGCTSCGAAKEFDDLLAT